MPTLNWAGKDKVVNHHLDVPMRVLEKVYGFDANGRHEGGADSGNMIIHGDNLAALKALLPRYEGRVDCIYIDPPYNTGNEGWIYNDNVNDPQIRKWLGEVVGREGEDFSRHDKWLCMMYPRLRLLQKLLSPTGVLWISIGDDELANLLQVMHEVFGELGGIFIWKSRTKPTNAGNARYRPQKISEYVLMFTKDPNRLFNVMSRADGYSYPYHDEYGAYRTTTILTSNLGSYRRDTMRFSINGYTPPPEKRWKAGKEKILELLENHRLRFSNDGDPMEKVYENDNEAILMPMYTMIDTETSGTAESGKNTLNAIFGRGHGFDTVKPGELLEYLIGLSTKKDAIVLDSFAGSGTTAHAVLKMNAADGGNRRFILVEMMDYAESITAERVKRVVGGYGTGERAVEGTGGCFDFFELGPALMEGDALNEELPVERIREYVWWTETRQAPGVADPEDPYLLGVKDGTAYYFCYERGRAVALNRALLRKLRTKAEAYVVFADTCVLDEAALRRLRIAFKKIPRDIARP